MTFSNTVVTVRAIMQIIEEHDYTAGLHELANKMREYHANPSDIPGEITMGGSWNNTILLYKTQERDLRKIPHFESVARELGLRGVLGDAVAEKIQSIMRTEAYDTPQQIESLVNNMQSSISHVQQMLEAVKQLKIEFKASDSGFLSIEYTDESIVRDIEQLVEQLSKIKTIMYGYAKLAPELEDSAPPRVISISKSSPLGIDLSAGLVVLKFVGKGVEWVMDRYGQLLAIRLQMEKLKEKQMLNTKVEEGLKEQEGELFSKNEIENLVTQLFKDAQLKTTVKGVKNEIKMHLVKSTETLVQIVRDGASVRIHPPEKSKDSDKEKITNIEKINANIKYSKIHKLTLKIKQLENKATTQELPKKTAKKEGTDETDQKDSKAK